MTTKNYALIGHPVAHSMSVFVHTRLFNLTKTNAVYNAIDIIPSNLDACINELNELNGYNVTLPFKRTIIQYMDNLSRKAKIYGSVNTVLNNTLIEGHTTDSDGFLSSLEKENVSLSGRVVILGAGGVARTLAYESVIAGANTCIAATPYNLAKASSLSGEIRDSFSNWDVDTCLVDRLHGDIDLLINATPCGMYPDVNTMPVDENILSNCKCVFDAVYNPAETLLLKKASSVGCKTINGLYMLIAQAAFSHKIWYGAEFSNDDLLQLYEDCKKEQEKIFY